jgi:spore germination protein YaaH
MTTHLRRAASALIILSCLGAALPARAADIEVSGWIPYWRVSEGTKDARKHIKELDAIHPFTLAIKNDGTLSDLGGMKKSSWTRLFKDARKEDVLVLPTVTTSNTALVYGLLSDPEKREEHIEAISETVRKGKYDGIDINYEGKSAATKPYFSLFLKELKEELGSRKTLSCTIEAHTPPDSLYTVVPATIEYANDLVEINRHCDRVNVMAYDQQRADVKLNQARIGSPYIPVADAAWVRKVMEYMSRDIDRSKMVLGVPTYGEEWDLAVAPQQFRNYGRLWSFGQNYAEDLADDLGIEPMRNAAGELSFTHLPPGTNIPASYRAPRGTHEANEAAARALAYANATGQTVLVNVAWWSDAEAMYEKAELAEELGLKGIALFRIDGGEDQDIWEMLD